MTNNDTESINLLELAATRTLRVAALGNVDSGKSTLIGALSHSTLDDGNGYTRKLVCKYSHELETGRTCTISTHVLGFDDEGQPLVVPRCHARYPEAYIGAHASKTVMLMDLCGHEKYLRTTVTGLSQGMIDYGLIMVSASQPPNHMTIQHLSLCMMYKVPVIVVVTKIDSTPSDVLKYTMKRIQQVVRDAGMKAFEVRNEKDINLVQNKMTALVPVVKVSCVTGENLDVLKTFLHDLPRRRRHENKINRPFEFLVEDIFTVQGVGTVLSGFVNAGQYNKGGAIYVGPTKSGDFLKTTVKSIHVMQTNVDHVHAGHSACFAVNLTKQERKSLVRRRMFIFDKPVEPTKTMVADIVLTKGAPVTMTKGKFQVQLHILHQRPTCRLIDFESTVSDAPSEEETMVLSTDLTTRAPVRAKFRLLNGAYYVRPGMRVVLRHGGVRGVGWIVEAE